ncbi:MAG TPA: MFS transporter [Acetobacteraceae bacterium]
MPGVSTFALLRHAELRAFLLAAALSGVAESAFTVLLGLHVYELAHAPLSLGLLGLSEAVPAIGLVLPGGYVADRAIRRHVVAATRLALGVLAGSLALLSGHAEVGLLYAVAFLAGGVRAFDDPAATGLEAEILPREQLLNAVSLIASVGRIATLLGPVMGTLLYEFAGPGITFACVAGALALSATAILLGVAARPAPPPTESHMIASIREGLRYVFASQVIVGSMALDLFAVFFGGVTGLLPVFAVDILHAGPAGVGLLRAASSAGALVAMLVATRHPPRARAGIVLHMAVAGFGIGIIVFGLSRSLPLSVAALVFAGACDGTSVVVRRAIVRVAAPDALRGRVAAVRGLFINASNELGSFESGILASFVGAVPAVWLGGLVTLGVVSFTACRAPKLLRLDMTRIADY